MEGGGGEGGEGGEREGEGAFVADDRPLKRVNRKTRARDKRSRERERERARAREKARDREREIYYERFSQTLHDTKISKKKSRSPSPCSFIFNLQTLTSQTYVLKEAILFFSLSINGLNLYSPLYRH